MAWSAQRPRWPSCRSVRATIKPLGIPQDLRAAVRLLQQGQPRRIDLGRTGSTYFGNGLGTGLAQVASETRRLPNLFKGKHTRLREVTSTRARRVTVETARPVPIHADGEVLSEAATRLEVEIVPRALRVLCP